MWDKHNTCFFLTKQIGQGNSELPAAVAGHAGSGEHVDVVAVHAAATHDRRSSGRGATAQESKRLPLPCLFSHRINSFNI